MIDYFTRACVGVATDKYSATFRFITYCFTKVPQIICICISYGLPSGGMYTTPILISYGSDRHLPCSCSQTRESDSRVNRTYLCSASDTKMNMPPESRLAHRCFIIRGKWEQWYPGNYCWKCFPFIVSTKAIMSCDLIKVCKSWNPNLSPKSLMFQHRILTLLVVWLTKSFLSTLWS